MLKSMTGFGQYRFVTEWGQVSYELRTVNHRYLELNFKWPESCRYLEPQVRTLLKEKLARGKVELSIALQFHDDCAPQLTLNQALLNNLTALGQTVQEQCDVQPASVMAVLGWPDMIQKSHTLPADFEQAVLTGLNKAIDALVQVRVTEGQALAGLFAAKTQTLATWHAKLLSESANQLATVKDKIRQKVAAFDETLVSTRLEQELVFFINRLDVDEELARLHVHITSFSGLITCETAVGRRMDFLLQEMNREVNTIAAKAGNVAMSQAAVEMKVIIEQLREQVQNIE